MSPASTQGCSGAPSCLEDVWKMGQESDTFLPVISQMVVSKGGRSSVLVGSSDTGAKMATA